MSISLPNGTLLATPSTQTQYTAAVTRILQLSNFPSELKTRDIQLMFKDYEGDKGGFMIKWQNDNNALVVFADAGVAKRAYLSFLLSPPAAFPAPAKIKPYDQPDATQIIQSLKARSMGHRASMSSAIAPPHQGFQTHSSHNPSVDGLPQGHGHGRAMSMGMGNGSTSSGGGGGGGTGGMGSFAFPKSSSRGSLSGLASRVSGVPPSSSNGSNGNGPSHIRTGSSSASFSSRHQSGLGSGNFGFGSGALNFGNSSASLNSSGNTNNNNTSTSGAGGLGRLPTHLESLDSPARPSAPFPVRRTTREREREREREKEKEKDIDLQSRSASSSDTEPIVVMDHAPTPVPVPVPSGGAAGLGFGSWKMPSKPTGTGGMIGGSTGGRRESMSAEKAMREVEKALAGVETR